MRLPGRSRQTPDERYDELVSEHIWPELRSRGFRRGSDDFHRLVEQAWEIVHFYKQPAIEGDRVQFTVKLASHPHDGEDAPPPLMQCSSSTQLCEIAGNERTWREVRARTNLRVVAAEVVEELEGHGFAWLTAQTSFAR